MRDANVAQRVLTQILFDIHVYIFSMFSIIITKSFLNIFKHTVFSHKIIMVLVFIFANNLILNSAATRGYHPACDMRTYGELSQCRRRFLKSSEVYMHLVRQFLSGFCRPCLNCFFMSEYSPIKYGFHWRQMISR